MLKKRLVPVLLLRNGRMVKGVQFKNYRDTGDPIYAARVYNSQYVDELIILDIDATSEGRRTNRTILSDIAKECFMPLTIGGGIRSIQDIRELLLVGADKVVINTAAYTNPELIREASKSFGSQCIVVGIDVREEDEGYEVYSHSGTVKQGVSLEEHLQFMGLAGAGEFFINNISRDGLMQGYDTALIATVQAITNVPVIACGGAGNFMHLVNCFKETSVSALAMSSIFHFGDNNPIRARAHLLNHKIQIKNV